MRQSPQRLGDGVFAVDTGHVRREADASYLIVDGGRAAFVDTGSHRSVPNLLAALGALDIDLERVEYVLLTHVPLDHAGGAGALMATLEFLHTPGHALHHVCILDRDTPSHASRAHPPQTRIGCSVSRASCSRICPAAGLDVWLRRAA